MNPICTFILYTLIIVCTLCTKNTQVTGTLSGSETTNGSVTGTLYNADKTPGAGVVVKLLPKDFDPKKDSIPAACIDTTDNKGIYSFANVPDGTYIVNADFVSCKTSFLSKEIAVLHNAIFVPTDTLRFSGALIISMPDSLESSSGYFYIPGTTVSSPINGNKGPVILNAVPSGIIPVVYFSSLPMQNPRAVRFGVSVFPGDTAIIANTDWKYAKRLTLNTAADGAKISQTITNFPLLVRLTSANFDFGQAKLHGEDLRFAKSDNTPLPYEIERWDSANGLAEIWVAIDTVFGNDTTQYITMFWGFSSGFGAFPFFRGNAVFDKKNGWAGVWHLGEDAVDTLASGLYKNSVENANHGDDHVRSLDKSGIIGNGQSFQPGDKIQVTKPTGLLETQVFTLSAWVKPIFSDRFGSQIAGIEGSYLLGIQPFIGSPACILSKEPDSLPVLCKDSLTNINSSSWHHIAATYDGIEVRLYVDGDLKNTVSYAGKILYNPLSNFTMGNNDNNLGGFSFMGCLDEVEYSSVARPAAWIKLLFESQKIDAHVVKSN